MVYYTASYSFQCMQRIYVPYGCLIYPVTQLCNWMPVMRLDMLLHNWLPMHVKLQGAVTQLCNRTV